ncbi:MAG: peptidoglycan-binding protein [Clostridia bacterium]|nr:peptidoglycan-binding protein [Clostridia bacterium]
MKRTLKIIGLAGVLALCLLLTGCYQPPDEVNNGGQSGTTSTPFFNTVPPSPTVQMTPDTKPVDVQNTIAGINIGQETSQPTQPSGTDNGWGSWGSEPTASVTPIPNMIVLNPSTTEGSTLQPSDGTFTAIPVTPSPTPAPVTPSPTPKSLQRGFTGSDAVRAVQKRLKELGYYKGSADGDFGPATEEAVKAFQKANGLTADGKVGEKTLAKMNGTSAVSAKDAGTGTGKATAKPTAKVTNTPRPTSTPDLTKDIYLERGSKGKKVETLQRRLIELGWLSGSVTGNYDETTEAAVSAFQKKAKLWVDGKAGPDTLKKLYSSDAPRTSTPISSKRETLELGSEGSEVKQLQQKLKELNYLSGSADGKFGVATEAAVKAFQKNNNLTADGKAGTATLNKLYSGTAKASSGTQINLDNVGGNTSGRDTSGISSTGYITLEDGSSGEQVKTLQKRLKDLGYYTGSVDGNYGDGTKSAVIAFQQRNNLKADGKAGPATQRALYQSKSNITYGSMRQGEESSAVKNLQYTLYELDYYDGAIDGKYGQTTADAVRAFQIQNNITPVDGVAGSKTLSVLYSSDALPATASNPNYGTVQYGDTGLLVQEVQGCLIDYGYLNEMTGVYDDATVAAVKAFQNANGLTPDGKCGKNTLQVLFGY